MEQRGAFFISALLVGVILMQVVAPIILQASTVSAVSIMLRNLITICWVQENLVWSSASFSFLSNWRCLGCGRWSGAALGC